MMFKAKSIALSLLVGMALLLAGGQANAATTALTPGANYTVTLDKMLSDGSTTTVSSSSATADSNGKITFSFSSVPTCPSANFLIITVKDSSGNVVRESFVPAPPAGSTNSLGVNGVSTKQAQALVKAGSTIGSDDPMVMAFGLLFTRSDALTSTDISSIATLGKLGIINGMETFMTNNGVTSTEMTKFKNALVCNQPHKDLSNFTSLEKSAVDATSTTTSSDDMGKAGGMIADVFIDAAAASGVDLNTVQAAFNAAGSQVNGSAGQTAMNAMSSSVRSAMNQSVQSFMKRLSTVRVQKSYSDALTTLGSSGAMVTQFNSAVTTLSTALSNIDTTYASYYQNPSTMTSSIQTAINNAYSNAFTNFQTGIAASNTAIGSMKSTVASALGVSVSSLPSNLGTYTNFNGKTVNWPVTQVAAVDFIANKLSNSGSMSYTRTTLPIPANMTWLSSRTNFTSGGMPASFAALMGIQQDIQIAENTRYYIFDSSNTTTNGNPTMAQQQAANLAFKNNLATIANNIGGTTDGSTAYSTAQKKALVLSQLQPSLN